MFRLATPIASAQPISDFDDISTIITHSSLTGSRKTAPWQHSLQDNGHVFYVELTTPGHPTTTTTTPATTGTTTTTAITTTTNTNTSKTDARSVCSLCSTRSCHSCASGDTGYSSDADAQSTQSQRGRRWEHRPSPLLLDCSSHDDSLSLQSRAVDFFFDDDLDDGYDDDGVSVDLLLDEAADWTQSQSQSQPGGQGGGRHHHRHKWDVSRETDLAENTTCCPARQWDAAVDGDLCERTGKCQVGKGGPREEEKPPHPPRGSGWRSGASSSGLCKRHYSYKASALEQNRFRKVDPVSEPLPLTCKCRGGGGEVERGRDVVVGGEKGRQVEVERGPAGDSGVSSYRQEKNLKEVVLRLGPLSQPAWDGRGSESRIYGWLEDVLGIVPGRAPLSGRVVDGSHSQGTQFKDCQDAGEKVFIKGLRPGGPALKSKELLGGEQLVRINGRQVTWDNLDVVLSSLRHSRKVRLTVTHPHDNFAPSSQPPSSIPSTTPATTSGHRLHDPLSVLNLLTNHHRHHHDDDDHVDDVLTHTAASTSSPSILGPGQLREDACEGVGVLYISMPEGEGKEEDDVVYEFPGGGGRGLGGFGSSSASPGSGDVSVGRRLRGCFFTLHHLLAEGGSDSRERLVRVGTDGNSLVNVACWKEGQDLLIVTAPEERLQASQLLTTTKGLVRLVRLLHGSMEQAFGSRENHQALDQFFACVFSGVQPRIPFKGAHSSLPAFMPGYMDCLPLPDDVLVSIGNTLTEYESADFVHLAVNDDGRRRSFTILGSMVMYKGYVTCCHLAPEDAKDVWTFLQHSGLRQLTTTTTTTTTTTMTAKKKQQQQQQQRLQQMLVWREVYPTRLCHEVAAINSVFGYSEPHARWFLMVVGLKNTLLACILEAGGCSTLTEGACGPDPLFLDQARAALVHLQSPDIVSACEIRLTGEGLPPTVTADHTALPSSLGSSSSSSSSSLSSQGSSGSRGLLPPNGILPAKNPSSHSSSSSSSCGSCEQGMVGVGRGDCVPSLAVSAAFSGTGGHVLSSDVNSCKLSAGKDNALFLFCQVNQHEGVMITSPAPDDHGGRQGAGSCSLALHRHVTENFFRCVARIHSHFARSAVPKGYRGGGVLEDFEGDWSTSGCREEGVMFTCPLPHHRLDTKKPSAAASAGELIYWVVGRKFRNLQSREIYVCFRESTPQNVVELAFRLSLGSLSSA